VPGVADVQVKIRATRLVTATSAAAGVAAGVQAQHRLPVSAARVLRSQVDRRDRTLTAIFWCAITSMEVVPGGATSALRLCGARHVSRWLAVPNVAWSCDDATR
jgi:hypothetical protein